MIFTIFEDKNYKSLSSRNYLLSKKDLIVASKIAKKLKQFKIKIRANHNYKKKINYIKKHLIDNFKIKLDYLELRNEKDLTVFKKNKKFRLFVAYHLSNVRLIDNF